MTESCVSICRKGASCIRVPAAFIRAACWLGTLALLVAALPAKAEEQEDEYLRIYENIQQADSLNAGGKTAAALTKYQQAHADLVKFRKAYPNWRKDMVLFRMNYVAEKAAACNEKLNAAAPTPGPGGSGTNATAQTQSQPQAAREGAPTPEQPLVTLVEPGAEPRKVLRIHPKGGDKQIVALTITSAMHGQKEGKPQPEVMKFPALLITLESTVQDVSTEGDISYENVIAEAKAGEETPGSPPGSSAALNASIADLKGLTTSGVLSNRGFSKRRDAPKAKSGTGEKAPAAARFLTGTLQNQMDLSLTMLTAPLPEEPVGAGAKWEVKMAEKSMGIAKAVYEIVSLEEERVIAKTTVSIAQLPTEAAKNPQFSKMKIDGSGQVTVNLNRIMPTEGKLVQTMDFGSGGKDAAQGQNAPGKIVTEFLIRTK